MKTDLRRFNVPMMLLVVLNVSLSIFERPVWSACFAAVLLGYRYFLHHTQRPMPARWFQWMVQLSLGIAVWAHYQSILGDQAAGTLLMLLTCLKTFELRQKRDYFVCSLLCVLVLMSSLLLNQSLFLTLFLIGDVILIFAFLQALEQESFDWSWRRDLQPGFFLLLKSLPLAIMIFVLFPRFSTGFGTGNQTVGKTGISDELKPGSVSQLVNSDELVFRATYLDGNIPPRPQIYWRGAVLDVSNGLNWTRSREMNLARALPATGSEGQVEIYLEPGFDRYLFSGENTRTIFFPKDIESRGFRVREGRTYELLSALQSRERYYLQNEDGLPQEKINETRYLKLDEPVSMRMREFLKSYRSMGDAEIVRTLLDHFRRGGYQYSMQPPPSMNVDRFFFGTKTGFCEHYAATMATLLRELKIPARVVVGFQGGTPSFLENYISVRGYDAHAWVEYYDRLSSRWRRVDPTAQVNYERLAQGGQSYIRQGAGWLPDWFPSGALSSYFRARAFIDELDASWTVFLLRFDLARQKELLAKLGMEEVLFRALPVFLILGLILMMAIFYFLEAQRPEPLSVEEKLYREFLKRLKQRKLNKLQHEGALTFLKRIESESPDLAQKTTPILNNLIEARFGRLPKTAAELAELKSQIRHL